MEIMNGTQERGGESEKENRRREAPFTQNVQQLSGYSGAGTAVVWSQDFQLIVGASNVEMRKRPQLKATQAK